MTPKVTLLLSIRKLPALGNIEQVPHCRRPASCRPNSLMTALDAPPGSPAFCRCPQAGCPLSGIWQHGPVRGLDAVHSHATGLARALQNLAAASRMKEFPMRFAAVLIRAHPGLFQPRPLPSRPRISRGCAPPDWATRFCSPWWTPRACRDEWEQTRRWTSRAGVSDRVIAAAIRRAAADEAARPSAARAHRRADGAGGHRAGSRAACRHRGWCPCPSCRGWWCR